MPITSLSEALFGSHKRNSLTQFIIPAFVGLGGRGRSRGPANALWVLVSALLGLDKSVCPVPCGSLCSKARIASEPFPQSSASSRETQGTDTPVISNAILLNTPASIDAPASRLKKRTEGTKANYFPSILNPRATPPTAPSNPQSYPTAVPSGRRG